MSASAAALLAGARAVGFDLDGTLIDSAPDLAAAANTALRTVGLAPLPEAKITDFIGEGMDRLIDAAVQASAGGVPDESRREAARAAFRRSYGAQPFARSRVYPGVRTALRALQARRLSLCCLTNKPGEFAEALLVAAGLRSLFALVLTPAAAAERKPSPLLLQRACAQLAIAPAELVYVGDSSLDVQAARAAGCPVVGVSYGYHTAQLQAAGPDALLDSLLELAGRTFHDAADEARRLLG